MVAGSSPARGAKNILQTKKENINKCRNNLIRWFYRVRLMSDRSEAVKRWRKTTKTRMVEAMGAKCQCCGYDKCVDAMDFHHLDSMQKDFGFGKIRANCQSWKMIVAELRKCILVCAVCHREIHAGIRQVPENFQHFDEKYADYRELAKLDDFEPCPVCGEKKSKRQITCSPACGAKMRYGNRWDTIDVINLVEDKKMTYTAIGLKVGCSDAAVKKRYLKLKLLR